jgi:hypothetical protein
MKVLLKTISSQANRLVPNSGPIFNPFQLHLGTRNHRVPEQWQPAQTLHQSLRDRPTCHLVRVSFVAVALLHNRFAGEGHLR